MDLTNLTIVNTRPEHQAETLNKALHALGAKTIDFPTLEIEAFNTSEVKALCQQLKQYDIAIFVSANAVRYSQQYWPSTFPISTVMAIGNGTEKVLEEHNIQQIILPERFTSEGLLAHPALKSVQNKKIIIFCGKNSKPLLPQTLTQRGAIVILCQCYQRFCPLPDKDTLEALQTEKLSGIISTSKDSLKNLNTLIADEAGIKKIPLIVISPDMETLAQSQGWKKIAIAENATPEAVIATLAKLNPC